MTNVPVTATSIRGYKVSTTPIIHSYNMTKYHKIYTFVLIEENEIKNWKNYYRVLDYFSPESQ